MDLDITDFLPKYPNIHQDPEALFNPYNEDFYEAIFRKKEFYEERLPAVEEFPDVVGTQMKHQTIISRFLSSRTPYDQLLLVHEMGTGKSCTAVGVIEQIRGEANSFTGAMVFARGEGLLNNFRNELIFKCTKGQYIPRPEGMVDPSYDQLLEEYNRLTELEKVHRTKKMIRDFYTLNTFETFAKRLSTMRDGDITQEYSNKVIVIDEVHNLRLKEKKEGLDMYAQFFRLCHLTKNTKILLMSGTPMKDTPDEIAGVMNLILPLDQQLPTGDEFTERFFTQEGGGRVKLRKERIPELKQRFKGRISYLKAMQSDVEKVFEGDQAGTLTHFKVDEDYMSEFQTKGCNAAEEDVGAECRALKEPHNLKNGGYVGAYERDQVEKGVYAFSRQAALFVFPNGSYGQEGFNKYMVKTAKRAAGLGEDGKKKKMFNYNLSKELLRELQGKDDEERLEKLGKFSSKYAATIRSLLNAYEAGKSSFVYLEFVKGSGAILFSKILELFGYGQARGKKVAGARKRYAIITNETATQREIKDIIRTFNQPENMHGETISVIIGSRVIGEGFSLSDIQTEDILTPHWNYSETDQAIARGYRLGSHRALLAAGITPEVRVFQRVSMPTEGPSIDLEMYEVSEVKDINIKQVERVMAESAFDCALNYNRNRRTGRDGERECEYGDCEYQCDGVPTALITEEIANADLDYSTYQIYYASPHIRDIMDEVVEMFRERFRMSLTSVAEYFPQYTAFELETALRTMINESRSITNKYGFPSYLKEENNVFFLVDSLSDIGNYFSEYYTKSPTVSVDTTFPDIVDRMYKLSFPSVVRETCKARDLQQLQSLIVRLPIDVQESFLESAIVARHGSGPQYHPTEQAIRVRDLILEHFKNYYQKIEDVWVSSLLYSSDNTEPLRCLEGGTWKDCTEEYINLIEEQRGVEQTRLEKNPYGYYGIYAPTTGKFWLRSVESATQVEAEDKRKRTKGKACQTWDGSVLTDIVTKVFQIDPPDDFKPGVSKKDLWKLVQAGKWTKKMFPADAYDNTQTEVVRRAAYWSKKNRGAMCEAMKDFLEEKGFLQKVD